MAIQDAGRGGDVPAWTAGARWNEGSRAEAWRPNGAGGLAAALGWLGLGLGVVELAAPGAVARLIGVRDDDRNCRVLRAMGLREIASGLGVLAAPKPAGWIWARVAGDLADLSLLGAASKQEGADRRRIGMAATAVAGVAAVDLVCADRLSGRPIGHAAGALAQRVGSGIVEVRKTVTIGKPAEDLYRFWRDVENLPQVMRHLESVRKIDDRRSRWKARAPLGVSIEWDSEIIEEQPHRRIAWRSVEGAAVANAGSVSFAPATGDRGTMVEVELRYDAPGGALGASVAKLFGKEPGQQLQEDLRAFKQVMETGEIVRSDASISFGHPGQPPTQSELDQSGLSASPSRSTR